MLTERQEEADLLAPLITGILYKWLLHMPHSRVDSELKYTMAALTENALKFTAFSSTNTSRFAWAVEMEHYNLFFEEASS